MQTVHRFKGLVFVVVLVVLILWVGGVGGSEDVVPVRRGGVVVHSVGEQKSDMARMVEAYERLSSQYLSMVQQNLAMMATSDQQILNKLDSLEAKIDELDEKLDTVIAQTAPKTKPEPISATK
ncbi:MAG: hypothetical protein ACYSUT_04310 [Planctomycetota bacterium]|jgi:hypothetical protein